VLPGRAYPPVGLVLLGDRVQGAHRLRPMRKSDLFVHFVRDNLSCTESGLMEDDLARYNAFVRAVASTPAYELNVGSDLSTLGDVRGGAVRRAGQAICTACRKRLGRQEPRPRAWLWPRPTRPAERS